MGTSLIPFGVDGGHRQIDESDAYERRREIVCHPYGGDKRRYLRVDHITELPPFSRGTSD